MNRQDMKGEMTERYAIIASGGKGQRMGSDCPKQFLPIGGKPVLMRTIEAFTRTYPDIHIILVLPKAHMAYWQQLCRDYGFDLDVSVTEGGETRFHSVRNGLRLIPAGKECVVGIHDGVRPFISPEVIRRCYEAAFTHLAVIPALPSVESVRLGDIHDNAAEDRSRCWLVQTPQTFRADIIKRAYEAEYNEKFTDDASVVEATGQKITIVEGCRENIKITTPIDMKLAGILLEGQNGKNG